MGHLEPPDALSIGAGERALLVAEQLALHERGWQRGQVDFDQRALGVRRILVEHLGHRFLARAGLADDQYVGVRGRHLTDHLVDVLHLGRVADDALGKCLGLLLAAHQLLCELLSLEVAPDGEQHPIDVERLGDVVVGAEVHRLDRGARGAVGGHQDDVADVDVLGGQALQDLNAVLVGHAQVDQEQVRLFDRDDAQDLAAALGFERLVALAAQQLYQRATDRRVIIGDQDPPRLHGTRIVPFARRAFCGSDHRCASCSLLQTSTPPGWIVLCHPTTRPRTASPSMPQQA